MARGDHLKVARLFYWHHGIDMGNDRVIEFGPKGAASKVRIVSLSTFAGGSSVEVVAHPNRKHSAEATVRRAQGRLNETGWTLLTNNCEHFANWAIEGEAASTQVKFGFAACVALVVCAFIGTAR